MLIVKTESDRVKVCDARTGGVTLNLPVGGRTAGPALLQGDLLVVPVHDDQGVRTKVYDARTGQLKSNIP
jgi:hypothetical protein